MFHLTLVGDGLIEHLIIYKPELLLCVFSGTLGAAPAKSERGECAREAGRRRQAVHPSTPWL